MRGQAVDIQRAHFCNSVRVYLIIGLTLAEPSGLAGSRIFAVPLAAGRRQIDHLRWQRIKDSI